MRRWVKAQKKERWGWIETSKRDKKPEKQHWENFIRDSKLFITPFNDLSTTLDVGCGPDGLINYFPKEGRRIGLDPLIDSYTPHYEIPKDIDLIKGVGEHMPLRDGIIDFLFCINTLDHTLYPKQVLGEARRILKPGGCLLLDVYTTPLLDLIFTKLGYRAPFDEFHPHKLLGSKVVKTLTEIELKIRRKELTRPINPIQAIKSIFRKKIPIDFVSILNITKRQRLTQFFLRSLDLCLYFISKNDFTIRIKILATKPT